jgi:hypothetical protein
MKSFWITLGSILLVVGLAMGAQAAPIGLRILYGNDFHGFAEPYKPPGSKTLLGGVAYLSGAVDQARHRHPSLLLSAGDMIQGNAWANLFKGKSVIALMNAIKFDAMVVGNHEFDFGRKVLMRKFIVASLLLSCHDHNFAKILNTCRYDLHRESGLPDQVLMIIDNQLLGPLAIGIPVSRHRSVPAPLAVRSMAPSHVPVLAPPSLVDFRSRKTKPAAGTPAPPG